ncbi:MAG: MFS transporter small subunit [Actinomycetes bacterium]
MPTDVTRPSEGTGEVVRAALLWVLVAIALTYGIVQTVRSAAALFG